MKRHCANEPPLPPLSCKNEEVFNMTVHFLLQLNYIELLCPFFSNQSYSFIVIGILI